MLDFYFQVREYPPPLNLPTPTPAADRLPFAEFYPVLKQTATSRRSLERIPPTNYNLMIKHILYEFPFWCNYPFRWMVFGLARILRNAIRSATAEADAHSTSRVVERLQCFNVHQLSCLHLTEFAPTCFKLCHKVSQRTFDSWLLYFVHTENNVTFASVGAGQMYLWI